VLAPETGGTGTALGAVSHDTNKQTGNEQISGYRVDLVKLLRQTQAILTRHSLESYTMQHKAAESGSSSVAFKLTLVAATDDRTRPREPAAVLAH
jgi:hypothetical protein